MRPQSFIKLLCIVGIAFSIFLSTRSAGDEMPLSRLPVRIGWQVSTATQAQIAQVLKRTNVLENHGLEPRFLPFSFGAPQIEAAQAGNLDVVFLGDQPAIELITRGKSWKIVARLHYDRVSIMVPPGSAIQNIGDLRDLSIASPFGSVAHRELFFRLQQADTDASKIVDINMDILDIRRRVRSGGFDSWGRIDGVSVWEPLASHFELEGLARSLDSSRTLDVVAMSDDFTMRHRDGAVQLLAALIRAWYYFSQHPDRVRQWYLDEAQLGFSPDAVLAAAKLDPNFYAESLEDIDLSLTDNDLAGMDRAAKWAQENGFTGGGFEILTDVDQSLLKQAEKGIAEDRDEKIKVILPSAREAPMNISSGVYFFDKIPLWIVFAFMVSFAYFGIQVGRLLGKWRREETHDEPEGPVGTVVGAILGLFAFVIALTFAAAGSRFDARKQTLLEEVNAIGTAYLRAKLLPEPHSTTTRVLLRDYVEIRLGMYRTYGQPEKLKVIQERTASLQESLWSHAVEIAEARGDSRIYALFISSLNEVFDLHTKRVVLGAEYRIPFFVYWALGAVAGLAMVAVGFQFGMWNRRSLMASLTLSLTFALVLLLIVDLDRPGEGLIEVNQRPMAELYVNLNRQV